MNAIEQAKILGQAIADSEQFKAYAEAEARFHSDEEAQRLTAVYDENCAKCTEELKKEDITPQEIIKIRQRIAKEFVTLSENAVIREYLATKKEAEKLLAEVNSIIHFYVTGEEEHGHDGCDCGCDGGCSTCGGCH